jgi:hypothetical protein
MTAKEAYRLSRIQAEGWKAARTLSPSRSAAIADAEIDACNPYESDPERARWRTGFTSAL